MLITRERLEAKFLAMRQRQQWLQEAREAKAKALPPPPKPKPLVSRERMTILPRMHRVSEIADALGVSRQTVKNWFSDLAGVVKVASKGGPQRRIVTLLIPHQVFEDWLREHGGSAQE